MIKKTFKEDSIDHNQNSFAQTDEELKSNKSIIVLDKSRKVISQAWPEQKRDEIMIKSENHQIVEHINFDVEQIYFRQLTQADLNDIKKLHSEWFPLNYPEKWYQSILVKNNVIALGCFIDLGQKELMIGSIISRIKIGNDDVIEINRKIESDKQKDDSYFTMLFNIASCKCKSLQFEDDAQGLYIMTLGVIDECRKMGIGSMLLEKTFLACSQFYKECQFAYLHVVDYNHSAIRFYEEKNNFKNLKTAQNHYEIFGKEYDGLVLYKEIEKL